MLAAFRENFDAIRYSLGISMVFNGHPIIFFLRDSLKVVPLGSTFTVVFWATGLLLMIPSNIFKPFYKPNIILFQISLVFWIHSLIYFFYFNSIGKAATDMAYFAFIFAFYLLILYIPNNYQKILVKVIFWVCMFSNCALVYALMHNPDWHIGVRASFMFADAPGHAGNPHTPARNAVIGMIASGVLIWKEKRKLLRIFYYLSLVFGLALLVLTLAKTSILSAILMGMVYIATIFKTKGVKHVMKKVFSFRTALNLTVISVIFYFVVFHYFNLGNYLTTYNQILVGKFYDLALTSLNVDVGKDATVDASAMGRVRSFAYFKEYMTDPFSMIIGQGYKSNFMDVPILEALMNQGIFGFLFFNSFLLFLFIFSYKEILANRCEIAVFTAYLFIYTIPQMVTNGRPQDPTYWFLFILMIRFLGIKYSNSEQPFLNFNLHKKKLSTQD